MPGVAYNIFINFRYGRLEMELYRKMDGFYLSWSNMANGIQLKKGQYGLLMDQISLMSTVSIW